VQTATGEGTKISESVEEAMSEFTEYVSLFIRNVPANKQKIHPRCTPRTGDTRKYNTGSEDVRLGKPCKEYWKNIQKDWSSDRKISGTPLH
jgi:hypothetical protein